MITEHYVEKSGYWIYNTISKTFTHSSVYPHATGVLSEWIYAAGPGTIRVKNGQILDFIPYLNNNEEMQKESSKCWTHRPKEYIGFTEKYFYCEVCGIKLQ